MGSGNVVREGDWSRWMGRMIEWFAWTSVRADE
jgi:hypothetical protein